MHSSDKCLELGKRYNRFVNADLIDLESRLLNELLEDSRELYNNMKAFEKTCADSMPGEVYRYHMSMYHLSLLKLSTALEEKTKSSRVEDEFIKHVISFYTQDEKNALRELERFSKLDPKVTRPKDLADIIAAEKGEIYRLVREAVAKGYLDLGRVIKTWESDLKIRDHLTYAFIIVYQARFENVVKAVLKLLEQQPGWLKRLFKEYESALIESAKARKELEEKLKEAFSEEVSGLGDRLRKLEEENSDLRRRLSELLTMLALTESERKKQDEELSRIRAEYESLRSRYGSLLEDLNRRLDEVKALREELREKECELERVRASREATQAEKLAMENEVAQLRRVVSDYEKRIRDYMLLESRLKELESALRGEVSGNLVRREEVEYYYEVVAGRARRMLESREVRVFDPRYSDYRTIKRWDAIVRSSSSIDRAANPVSVRSVVFTKLAGFLSKKKDLVVEYSVVSHFTDSSHEEFDARPVDTSEFVTFWRERLEEAEREGYHHVLVVLSPTGFTDELISRTTGDGDPPTSIASRHTTVYLVDPVKGKVYHNPHDPAAKNNRFLAELELSEEQVERVVDYVSSKEARQEAIKRSPTVSFLTIGDISKATGVTDTLTIRRALSALEEKGLGRVKRKGNELVFEYKAY